jgi:hypothetical protein
VHFSLHILPLILYFSMNVVGSVKVWRRLEMLFHSPKAIDL